jgi:uncharacterized protein (DUF362 family)
MNSENQENEKAVILDMTLENLRKHVHEAFDKAGITSLIKNSREVYIHVPVGATFFKDQVPLEGTYLNVELADAIISVCAGKKVTIYETPATAHKNIKNVFEKLGYIDLIEKYSNVQLLYFEEDSFNKEEVVALDYGFEYPPLNLPSFLFDKENLIISFSNPKAPFSEKVAGFNGLPFSLSGKALIMGSILFSKKNLLHLAFSDLGIGLQGFIVDALDKIRKAGVTCVGVNGGHFAGVMEGNVKVSPVEWNILTISKNLAITDLITASLMGFKPHEVEFFLNLNQKGLCPIEPNTIDIVEIGNGRARLEDQLKSENQFLPSGTPIKTRQWIFGLLSQISPKDRLPLMGRILPSIIRYKFSKKKSN